METGRGVGDETALAAALVDDLDFPGERRDAALAALAALGPAAGPALLEVVLHGATRAKCNAVRAVHVLAQRAPNVWHGTDEERAVGALISALQSSGGDERAGIVDVLGLIGTPSAIPVLIEQLADANYVCVSAALALGRMRDPRVVAPLAAVLADEQKFWVPRGAAAVALGELGALAEPGLPALERALRYPDGGGETWDERAREAVEDAIARIRTGAASSLTGKGSRYEMWGIY